VGNKNYIFFFLITIFLFADLVSSMNEINDFKKNFVLKLNPRIIEGDANADGKVDILDLAIVGQNYGSEKTITQQIEGYSLMSVQESKNLNFDELADTNNDSRVDILDLALVGINYNMVYSQQESNTTLSINPLQKEVHINESFLIDMDVSTDAEVFAVELEIRFNPLILEVQSVKEDSFLKKDGTSTFPIIEFNNSEGKITYASTRFGTQVGVSGEGTLININFTSIKKGNTFLSINESKLIDANIQEILGVETRDGFVEVKVDKEPPKLKTIPNNETITYGDNWNGVQFEAESDDELTWSVDDIINFEINQTGFLKWRDYLEGGNYYIEVKVEDTFGQEDSTVYNLEIEKADLIIIADNKSKTYGESDPAFTASYQGFVLGENENVLGGSLKFERELGEDVGTYNITPSGLISNNYNINYINKTLTINEREIEITADDKSKVYGEDDPELTYQITSGSLVFDNKIVGKLEREEGENIGAYSILKGTLSIDKIKNYDLDFIDGTLSIIGLEDQCNIYFDKNSPLTYSEIFRVYTDCTTDFTIYKNGNIITNNSLQELGAGTYLFSVQRENIEDYENVYDEDTFIIKKATPTASLTNTRSWIFTYDGNSAIIGIDADNSGGNDVKYILWKNDVNVGTSDLEVSVGDYNYKISTVGGENYTEVNNLDSKTLTINKAVPEISLTVNPSWLVKFGTQTTITGVGCLKQLNCNLYRNNVLINNPDVQILGAGNYNYIYNTTENENYTSKSVSNTLIVQIDATAFEIKFEKPTPENSERTIQNQVIVNVSITGDVSGIDSCILKWNDVNETMAKQGNYCSKTKITADGVNYSLKVYVKDNAGNLGESETRTFRENSKPTIQKVELTPENPNTFDDLICNAYGWYDKEEDNEGYYFNWYKNDELQLSRFKNSPNDILGSDKTMKGDEWICEVVSYDDYENGSASNVSVLIINFPLFIDDYHPKENLTINEKEEQVFSVIYSDPDVPKENLDVKWYVNEILVEENKNNYTFRTDYNSQGFYEVKVIVSDGDSEVKKVWGVSVLDTSTRIFLEKGNNIFSLPRNEIKSFNKLDTDCEVVFSNGRANLAYYIPSGGDISSENYKFVGLNDELYPGQGYFIQVKDDCYIEMSGNLIKSEDIGYLGTKKLKTGWNLVGAPTYSITFYKGTCELYSNVGILKYRYDINDCNDVEDYNGGYEYCSIESGVNRCRCEVNEFEPGFGYWIRVKNDC